jgi:hypothetical protein
MSEFESWLAAMPSDAALDERIAELESKIEAVRVLKQLRPVAPTATPAPAPASASASAPAATPAPAPVQNATPEETPPAEEPEVVEIDPRSLSPERRQIIRVMRDLDKDAPAVAEITRGLHLLGVEIDEKNVATNMQRMRGAGLVVRPSRGRYTIVPEALRLVEELDARESPGRLEMTA